VFTVAIAAETAVIEALAVAWFVIVEEFTPPSKPPALAETGICAVLATPVIVTTALAPAAVATVDGLFAVIAAATLVATSA
jgi:hypothetical protein